MGAMWRDLRAATVRATTMETLTATAAELEAPPRRFQPKRLLVGLGVALAVGVICRLLGWDVVDWLSELWDTVTAISIGYLVAGVLLQTLQTSLTAFAWLSILRFAYPSAGFPARAVLACYATSVALNGFLPANLGTLVMLLMYVAVIAGATFAGVFAGYLVHKIFFTIIGAVVYLYLFLTVGGSFDIKFSFADDHTALTILVAAGVVVVCVLLVRRFWPRLRRFWAQAEQGGGIVAKPRLYFTRVFAPELLAWCAKLGVIAVFLAAYAIPVTFHTVMAVVGGNSIANVASVTPGGVGVNQAFNVASLKGVTDPTTATAYSVGQQLVTTMWNILFAAAMLVWAFGWSGGKELVTSSYAGAKDKAAEQAANRRSKKAAQT